MIDILLSIQPHWCKEILSLRKPVELRKTCPRPSTPFRVYLYETKAGRGMVVGECVCWMVEKAAQRAYSQVMIEGSELSSDEIAAYGKGHTVCGWYLAKVKEYERPRPLSDFGLQRAPQSWCYVDA